MPGCHILPLVTSPLQTASVGSASGYALAGAADSFMLAFMLLCRWFFRVVSRIQRGSEEGGSKTMSKMKYLELEERTDTLGVSGTTAHAKV